MKSCVQEFELPPGDYESKYEIRVMWNNEEEAADMEHCSCGYDVCCYCGFDRSAEADESITMTNA